MDNDRGTTARQLLHAATGDREAEGEVLAEQSDADPQDATLAVKRAHGDVTDRPKFDTDLATAEDVREAEADAAGSER